MNARKTFSRMAVALPLCSLCYLLLSQSCLAGNTNYFAFTNALGLAISNTTVTLTPTSPQAVNGFNGIDALTFTTTNDGSFLATNLLPGTYTVRENNSFFIVDVPSGNGFFIMATNISGILTPGSTAVYTRAQSDARYFQVSNAVVFLLTASNSVFVGTNYFIGSTNFGGAWSNLFIFNSTISNATLINATLSGATTAGLIISPTLTNAVVEGATAFSDQGTNLATNYNTLSFQTNLTFGSLAPQSAASNILSIARLETNGDWSFNVTPAPTNLWTNLDLAFWCMPWTNSNQLCVVAVNLSSSVTYALTNPQPYRVRGFQDQ